MPRDIIVARRARQALRLDWVAALPGDGPLLPCRAMQLHNAALE